MAVLEHAEARSVLRFRALLIAAFLAGAGIATLLPRGEIAGDAQLLLVLPAMALIKAALLAGIGRALWLRARWPLGQPTRLAYLCSTWLMAGATGAIWRGEAIALAAVAFHLGLAALAITAWRDRASGPLATRRAKPTGAAPEAAHDRPVEAIRRAA